MDDETEITLKLSWGRLRRLLWILGRSPYNEVCPEITDLSLQANAQASAYLRAEAAAERAAAESETEAQSSKQADTPNPKGVH
jgi:hypothetical protein